MTDGLILVTQVGLVALVLLMAFRMVALVRSAPMDGLQSSRMEMPGLADPSTSGLMPPASAPDRTELFTQLHILAGLQERDCRIRGLDLAESSFAVRAYAAAWLYGAACTLCDRTLRHSDSLAGIVAHIASRKTGLKQSQALQAIATLTNSSAGLACFREGLDGAKFWQESHYVASQHSLYEAVTANAFI
ncbi:hypothetical protein [Marinobacter apostichopi]|uniref:hypothetical protein n=1 Tax=Marinobacter apostichopi TaxID=3035454 RepID=UPI0025723FC8|nr:hypothetical protein [Marinobacter sp. LA51]